MCQPLLREFPNVTKCGGQFIVTCRTVIVMDAIASPERGHEDHALEGSGCVVMHDTVKRCYSVRAPSHASVHEINVGRTPYVVIDLKNSNWLVIGRQFHRNYRTLRSMTSAQLREFIEKYARGYGLEVRPTLVELGIVA
ncbi:MAG: hypothetical protein UY72_C0064G0003 [Candidatus Uhrbacteria bacterium GW2011_GWD2_52_7]|uniref:Uncharacterized protein n=1 Tax=Candidatus Uhrbacteria bacterium GW2011_GWD2_52_7 TaxID=1618989 RepID=A0A0G1XCT3_9BACT|nr:MAG: hypothetical protein UY72_C0064G0003 [Candidatus Uhrbacteria bacterium GW2011_GWD2_52_7]